MDINWPKDFVAPPSTDMTKSPSTDKENMDVIIKMADGTPIIAHRHILSAKIPYFNSMFNSGMKEDREKEVIMEGSIPTPITMKSFIQFANSGKIPNIHPANVQDLLMGASFLQMDDVVDACAEFLTQNFDPSNIFQVFHLANMLHCTALLKSAESFLINNFTRISQESEDFLKMEYGQLRDLLVRDDLNVRREVEVFEAVLLWLKFKKKTEPQLVQEYLRNLLQEGAIRLPIISLKYLKNSVASTTLIRTCPRCSQMVQEIIKYRQMEGDEKRQFIENHPLRNKIFNHRASMFALYALGSSWSPDDTLWWGTMKRFDVINSNWDHQVNCGGGMPRMPKSVAVLENKIYFKDWELAVDVTEESKIKQSWTKIKLKLSLPIFDFMGAHNNQLYFWGTESSDFFDPVIGFRISVLNVPYYMMSHPMGSSDFLCMDRAIIFEDHIYTLGLWGPQRGVGASKCVYKYDLATGSWLEGIPMLTKRSQPGVAVLNGKLYACGGLNDEGAASHMSYRFDNQLRPWFGGRRNRLNSAEVFDSKLNNWSSIASMNKTRANFALTVFQGKLHAAGGDTSRPEPDQMREMQDYSVEIYDPVTDEWTLMKDQLPMRVRHGGLVVFPTIYSR